jgi:OmpA-OmpF porin, OOP family
MKRIAWIGLLAAAALALPGISGAQSGPMFKSGKLDERALVDALAPPEPEIRTRSIRVAPGAQAPYTQPRPAAQASSSGSASLLITFETNSAELTQRSKSMLDVMARALTSDRLAEFGFSVEGHADPRGSTDLNARLSQARADSVVDYLVTQHNIDRARLKPVGKGDSELANSNNPAAPENRRVTFRTQVE